MHSANNLIPSPELRAELESRATIISKPKGAILFRRGDDAAGVFLVRKGRVKLGLDLVTRMYPDRTLGAGAIAGLPATVSGEPYSLTAKVAEDSELAFVPRETVLACLQNNSSLCFQVMYMLGGEISGIRSAFKENGSRFGARA
jgi:CRP-like cAMP-binding protein